MRYRISQIKLGINEPIELLKKKIEKKVSAEISDLEIIRESVDAREKPNVYRVYTVDFDSVKKLKLDPAKSFNYELPNLGEKSRNEMAKGIRPIVVGFGPCGMFAALILAKAGMKPIVLERGMDVDRRTEKVKEYWEKGLLDPNTNVQFGEGGAGTFSDGKLATGIKDPRVKEVLRTFADFGAPKEITYMAKPHIGTDILRDVVKNIREEIISLGGDVRFESFAEGIVVQDGKIAGVKTNGHIVPTTAVIFGIGHSSRDTLKYLYEDGLAMSQKQFSIGVRIEHDQDIIDKSQYGIEARKIGLPAADYKLNYRTKDGRGVYTFCMCPGGKVISAASEPGMVVTNGMSYHKRDSGKANSAVLCDVRVEDFGSADVLAGVEFQRIYERLAYENSINGYEPPSTTWKDFRDKTEKAKPVMNSIPKFAEEAIREAVPDFGRKIKGFDGDNSKMYAVESRSSSPIRFFRDEDFEGAIAKENENVKLKGFYPAGEGAGYAGGITSAAVDGIKVAEAIIKR